MLGWCAPHGKSREDGMRRVNIGISNKINRLSLMLLILLHESVHQYEFEIGNDLREDVAHGKGFYEWRDKIFEYYNAPLHSAYDF